MTRSTLPPDFEVPVSTVSELHTLYHEAAVAEPSLTLDRRILDAARAELRANGATKRRTPWWKPWLTATSAIAVVVVGLSVTWRVMDEQERGLRDEMNAAEDRRDRGGPTADSSVTAARPVETKPAITAQAPPAAKRRRVESPVVRDAPLSVQAPVVGTVPAAPAPVAAAAMAPGPVEEAAKKSQRAEPEEPREKPDAAAAAGPAAGPARAVGRMKAESLGASGEAMADALAPPPAGSSAKSLAAPGVDAATPEAWLKRIRELRAAGRGAEAAQSLARFRVRYPDFVLPDDPIDLK